MNRAKGRERPQERELDIKIILDAGERRLDRRFKTSFSTEFMEEPLVVVVPSHLAHEDPHHLLRTQPYIQYDRSVAGGQLAERYLHQQGISPHRRLEINGLMSIAAMVDQGLGISLLPDWSALWDRGLGIEKIPLPDPAPIRRTGYVWGLRRPHEPIARMFLQHAEDLWKLPRKVKSGRAPNRAARGA